VDWRVVFWILFLFVLLADQLIKFWARHAFPNEQASKTIIPNVFDLTLTYNKGIAFGMFPHSGVLLAPIAIVIGLGSMLYSMKHRSESPWVHVAMALLSGGALGNLFDRMIFGKVTDMFHFRAFEFPIFNLADSCITVAATILILRWGTEWAREPRGHHAKAETHTEPADTHPQEMAN
jgi:signal peptidase II